MTLVDEHTLRNHVKVLERYKDIYYNIYSVRYYTGIELDSCRKRNRKSRDQRRYLDARNGFLCLHHTSILGRLSFADDLRRSQVVGAEEDTFDQHCRFVNHHCCVENGSIFFHIIPNSKIHRRTQNKSIGKGASVTEISFPER